MASALVATAVTPVAAVAAIPGSTPAAAHGLAVAPAQADSVDHAPATVLGLDAEETAVGTRLTKALRRAFGDRGLGGGEEANLSELRLALGCRSDKPECLAGGGSMLRSRRLIYGSVHKFESGRWALDISILVVEPVELVAHETFKFEGVELAPARIDGLADRLVSQMLVGEVAVALGTPPPPPEADGENPVEPEPSESSESSEPKRDRKWVWQYQRPTPRWKWAGFGVSLGVGLVGAVGAITTSAWIAAGDDASWGFRPDLLEAAEQSLNNPNEFNQVDPAMAGDLCEYNRRDDDGEVLVSPGGGPGARDIGVGEVCNRGLDARLNSMAFTITAAIGLASTAVFTVLLFVHRKPEGKVARAWRRRGLQLGSSLVDRRGAGLSLRGRF